jgi:hypothetical protein
MKNNLKQHLQEHCQRTALLLDTNIILFADEHSIPLQDAQQKLICPYLSHFTESFSAARLTIAMDRARLVPQTDNELIFLHDTLNSSY